MNGITITTSLLAVVSFVYGVKKDREAKRERERASRREFNRGQLEQFYSPVLGKLEKILAKSITRQQFDEVFSAAREDERRKHVEEHVAFNNRILREEILPRYQKVAGVAPPPLPHKKAAEMTSAARFILRSSRFECQSPRGNALASRCNARVSLRLPPAASRWPISGIATVNWLPDSRS
jgi:hypothetical protein